MKIFANFEIIKSIDAMKNYSLIIIGGLIIILNSCSYTTTIPIETMEPPTVFFLNPHNPITVNYKYFSGNQPGGLSGVDSLAADAAAYEMVAAIKQNPIFAKTNIVTTQLAQDNKLNSNGYILSSDELVRIAAKTKGDVILSLDYFSFYTDTTVGFAGNDYQMATLIANVQGLWHVYSSDKKIVLGEYLFKQSYPWYRYGRTNVSCIKILPNLSEVGQFVGSECGKISAGAFTPYWNTVERNIYSGLNNNWNKARLFAEANKWDEAVVLWNYLLSESKNPKERWQAAYNLAVASEVKNDMILALNWLDLADTFVSGTLAVKAYREMLQLRIKSQKIMESFK